MNRKTKLFALILTALITAAPSGCGSGSADMVCTGSPALALSVERTNLDPSS